MGQTSPLKVAFSLLLRRGSDLLAPPGSEAAIGALVALGGWAVGLALPTQISLARLARVLVTQGPAAFDSALDAVRPPGVLAIEVWLALAVVTMVFASGWIQTALALAADRPVDDSTWIRGLAGAGRTLAWNAASLVWIAGLGVLIAQVGFFAIRTGLAEAATGALIMPSLIGIGTAAVWSFVVGAGVYYLAVCMLGAVVAVAEPNAPLLSLFGRAPRVFVRGGGWQGVRDVVLLLGGWALIRCALGQLLVPVVALHFGTQALVFGVAGALLAGALAVGDAIVLLLILLLGTVVYQRGAAALAPPQGPPG